ncbi:hypothetical protein [Streptomyces harbinensis]|uniref:hypothetical protein n=1 Tax=Streptomyces harbinensis TaxID=1176198 RepID=UPI0036A138B7
MPGPGEPLWLEEDRAWAYALAEVEADVCPDCGRPWPEASNPDLEFAWRAELARCHACATAHRAMAHHEEQGGDTRGLHVHVTRG